MGLHIVQCFAGLGLLQEGPLPAFFEESQLQRIVNIDSVVRLTTAETQMRGGLDQLGFIRVLFAIYHFKA